MLEENQRQIRILAPAALAERASPKPEIEQQDECRSLRDLLAGAQTSLGELPALSDLLAGIVALATGARHKVVLPLGRTPAEFALVRAGDQVCIDCYGTDTVPEVLLLGRRVSLQKLLESCVDAARASAQTPGHPANAQAVLRLAGRAEQTKMRPDPHFRLRPLKVMAGTLEDPGEHISLAFGFEAEIKPSVDTWQAGHSFADVHALLFEGHLWAFSRGKVVTLMRGPIMLAAQRMVAGVRALVEAWESDRPLNVRLCSENFAVGFRLGKCGAVALSLGGGGQGLLTLPALDVPGAALPVLRLASDLIRALLSADRTQARNLRLTALRAEVRTLRRAIRARNRLDGFENRDPDRLRMTSPEPRLHPEPIVPAIQARPGRLRFTERWSAEIDGLDAGSTFLCGDRVVVATPKLTLALARDNGEVIWSQPSARATSFMVGKVLLQLLSSGEVELREVGTGIVYGGTRITPRSGGPPFAVFAGGGSLPPVAAIAEGRSRLVGVDLRTGEPRWRFNARGCQLRHLHRAGRILLVTSDEGSISALEAASGELVWRFSDRARFCHPLAVSRELVMAASGEPGARSGALYVIELYSGRLALRYPLEEAASANPIATGSVVVVPMGRIGRRALVGIDIAADRTLWKMDDQGIACGGTALHLDRLLIVNAPSGRISALDLETGTSVWTLALSDPLTDDVPRQLEPILRHGALFVPAARVHVLRPADGAHLAPQADCDLVPDFLRVDERGWFYVAEESGHLRAYAPAPHLRLVR